MRITTSCTYVYACILSNMSLTCLNYVQSAHAQKQIPQHRRKEESCLGSPSTSHPILRKQDPHLKRSLPCLRASTCPGVKNIHSLCPRQRLVNASYHNARPQGLSLFVIAMPFSGTVAGGRALGAGVIPFKRLELRLPFESPARGSRAQL